MVIKILYFIYFFFFSHWRKTTAFSVLTSRGSQTAKNEPYIELELSKKKKKRELELSVCMTGLILRKEIARFLNC